MSEIDGKIVIVGDFIASEMEYVSEDDYSVFEQDGNLYASINGIVKTNKSKRTIKITSPPERKVEYRDFKRGDIVIGIIKFQRKFTVGLVLIKGGDRVILDGRVYGNIHVSKVTKGFIDKIDNGFKKNDLVRAKVLYKEGKEYELATDNFSWGVISADCPHCGTELVRSGRDYVYCPFCGYKGKRKLANDFGNYVERVNM